MNLNLTEIHRFEGTQDLAFRVHQADRDSVRPYVSKFKIGQICCLKTTITGTFEGTEKGGVINIRVIDTEAAFGPSLPKTRSQVNLLKKIERMIFYVQNGKQPNEAELYLLHEAIMEEYAPVAHNPFTHREYRKTLSDPALTAAELGKIIDGAFQQFVTQDIPETLHTDDLHSLFKNWQEYVADKEDQKVTEEEYRSTHPYCEFTFRMGTFADPLERIHIRTIKAAPHLENDSRNYLIGRASIHRLIHQKGWSQAVFDYPHLRGKIQKALELP